KPEKIPTRQSESNREDSLAPETVAKACGSIHSLLDHLDPEQRAAAAHLHGPLLIVAGPGTGKTRTLTYRIAHLIKDHHVEAGSCLAITFTNRAAQEMRERLIQLLPDDHGKAVHVMTFHSFGLFILKENHEKAGLPEKFRVIDESEQLSLLHEQLGLSMTKAKKWLRRLARINRGEIEPESDPEEAEILSAYRRILQSEGAVDFDDLIRLSVALLSEEPGLVKAYRDRFRWISVDEFQDVDAQQCRLLQLICPPEGNLCAIGDPDQAIYGFRGSDVRFFNRFQTNFPKAHKVYLNRNYRSTTTIVKAALQAIAPSSLEKNRELRAVFEAHQPIQIHSSQSEAAEAEWVVHSIEQMIGGTSLFSLDSKRVDNQETKALAFSDFAVLYRTDAQAAALEVAFKRSGIPYQKHGHRFLLENPILQKAIEALETWPEEKSMAERLELTGKKLTTEGNDEAEVLAAIQQLRSLSAGSSDRLEDLRARLTGMSEADLWDPRAERVSMLTLHASKGLEFPVVFIVGCEDGIHPLIIGDPAETDIDEERRLFFVGITRAEKHLFLSHAKSRNWRGQRQNRQPSPFLQDIEQVLLEINHQKEYRSSKPQGHQLDLFA
ncbi:MAG: ATP-dependent helicase, partial [Verrucomicrobiota bacterium]